MRLPQRILSSSIILCSLAACTSVTPIRTASGARSFLIDCSDMDSMPRCYRKANETCPEGYTVDNQQASDGFWTNTKTLTITCKAKPNDSVKTH
jgi:hypothetical protein